MPTLNKIDTDNPIDPKGNIQLCHFGDTALLFRPGAVMPYVVAQNYDRQSGEWSSGSYFDNLGHAFDAADPEVIEDASLRFTSKDVAQGLTDMGIEPTPSNQFEAEKSLKEIIDVAGENVVHQAIQECIDQSLIEVKDSRGESLDQMMNAKSDEAEFECGNSLAEMTNELGRE